MRVLAFSDLHRDLGRAAEVAAAAGAADLVIGAGDFCTFHTGLGEVMAALAPIAGKLVCVPGNHETLAELQAATPSLVLHGTAAERGGLRLVGLGGAVPSVGPAPFESWDLSEAEAEAALRGHDRADILILHAPPEGVADDGRGSAALRAAIARLQPKLAVCGHIHDAWGQSGVIGATPVHNLGPRLNWFEV
jgi:Icc-related predicted phosphoesterase